MLFENRPVRIAVALLSSVIAIAGVDAVSAAGRKVDEETPSLANFSGPARIAVVSLARQRVSFYDAAGGVVRAPISSGQSSLETPVGIYSVLQKEVEHTSNIYDDAQMPFMQRITWSGVALHAGALPGYAASHGCVRMPLGFAEQIYDKTRLGLRVVISSDDVAPVSITHPLLFQPRPLDRESDPVAESAAYTTSDPPLLPDVTAWPARRQIQEKLKAVAAEKSAEAKAAIGAVEPLRSPFKQKTALNNKAQKALKAAVSAKKASEQGLVRVEKAIASAKNPKAAEAAARAKVSAQAALEKADAKLAEVSTDAEMTASDFASAKDVIDKAEAVKTAAVAAAREAERKMLPASVFVSLKTQRLYIRQGHAPVMDVPVTIRDPEQPIGTHVFTALDYAPDGNTSRWSAVSVARYEDTFENSHSYRKGQAKGDHGAPTPTDAAAAAAALDRITIPPEIAERLSEYVWPGSSLIVSDEEMHKKETNNFTDFIVLVSGYPQGGIKKRRPPPDPYYDSDPYAYFFSPPPPRPYGRQRNRTYRTSPSPWSFW